MKKTKATKQKRTTDKQKEGTFNLLPERPELLSPVDLAKIAAQFCETETEYGPIPTAMGLFLQAWEFCEEHREDSLEELARAVGQTDLFLRAYRRRTNPWRLLQLDMNNPQCDACRFLAERHRPFTPRAAKRRVLEHLELRHMHSWLSIKQDLPRRDPNVTQKAYQEMVRSRAIANGYRPYQTYPTETSEFYRDHEAGGKVYLVAESLLQEFIDWQKKRRRTGGIVSLRTAALKNKRTPT